MTARSGWISLLLRSRKGFSSLSELTLCSALASAPKSTRGSFIGDSPKRYLGTSYSDFVRQYTALSSCRGKGMLEAHGKLVLGGQHIHEHATRTMLSFQLVRAQRAGVTDQSFVRSFASKASKKETKNEGQTRKEVSTIEDPFDAPTYNIPEKPVTFTEGASYSIVILAGLGVAVAAGYAVFKELIFEPKEYKVFNKALKRIQDDSQVRVRIGSPITGYGQESRNRAARQRIANKVFTDEDGIEHVQVGFYIRGPHGAGKVAAEMFKDNADKQWKYTYLIVQITQPSHSQFILESYMPAPPVPA